MVKIQKEHLAIASVPVQSWGELYNQDDALKTGTIFKELDLPFFAAGPVSYTHLDVYKRQEYNTSL